MVFLEKCLLSDLLNVWIGSWKLLATSKGAPEHIVGSFRGFPRGLLGSVWGSKNNANPCVF